jgi:CheY-like chemotaxis protein
MVVLVDDAPDFRDIFIEALKGKEIEVVAFASGDVALDYLQSAPHLPELVVVDYRIPGLSGDEFIRHVRRNPKLAGLKVILSSAQHDIGPLAEKVGADGILPKPFDLDELYRLVAAA